MDIRSVDLNLLVVLDALLRTRNVSRTAEQLRMSQPAVSAALARLRRMLGDPLFIRSSHGMQATPRALQLGPGLHTVLDSIKHDILQPALFDAATAKRTIVVSLSDVGELVFMPKLFARLRELAPRTTARSVSLPPAELESALEAGDVDLAIGYFPTLKGAGMYQQRLFGHTFVCAVRSRHPLVGPHITRSQFENAQHLIVEGKTNEVLEEALAANGIKRTVVLTLAHHLAVPIIVRDSNLVVTVPFAMGAQFAGLNSLRVVRPPLEVEMPVLRQYWHARFHRDFFNQWLRGVVAELFLEEPPVSRRHSVKRKATP